MKHTKIFKNALAVFSAAAVSAACMNLSAFAALDSIDAPPYTVFMSVAAGADSIWDPAETNVATVEENGTYELSYTFENGSASIEALIIDSDINAYTYAPEGSTDPIADGTVAMTIDSITLSHVDGTVDEIAYNGPSDSAFRTGDNGSSVRFNILNQWTSPAVADIDTALPGTGAAAGDVLTVTFSIAFDGEISTDTDTDTDTDTPVEDEFVIPEDSYYTFMSVSSGAESLWDPTAQNTAVFTEDGTYEMSYTYTLGSASIEAVIIDSNINAYDFAPEGCADPIAEGSIAMTIDSITLTRTDGTVEEIAYNGPSDSAFRTGDDGSSVRYNILNTWTSPQVADIDSALPGEGANEGDVLTVTFTITGLGDSPYSEVSYGDVDADGTVGLSDASAVLTEYASVAASLGSTFDEAQFAAADVDADSTITLNDASAILSYYAAVAASLNPVMSDFFPAAAK